MEDGRDARGRIITGIDYAKGPTMVVDEGYLNAAQDYVGRCEGFGQEDISDDLGSALRADVAIELLRMRTEQREARGGE